MAVADRSNIAVLESENGRLKIQNQELKIQNQELRDEVERVAGERDGLRFELDLEVQQVMAERARVVEEKKRCDDGVYNIAELNREIMLSILRFHSDLEEQINKKEAVMKAFGNEVLEMMRRTRAIVDSFRSPVGGAVGEASGENDGEVENEVMVMAALVEQELKKIEAAATAVSGRRGGDGDADNSEANGEAA